MKIIIDGDACPSISKIELIGKKYGIPVEIFCDINHYIVSDYAKVSVVDSGFQSVDMYVINNTKKDDIVVTQDFGVAALALGKKAYAISPKGMIFSNDNIERLLFERHLSQKARKAGLRGKNASKRKKEDDINLYNTIKKVINQEK